MSDEALLKEAESIRAVEQRLSQALSGSLEDVTSISPFLKELDISLISNDNDWRSIFLALNDTATAFEEFKKLALVKYMQYLVSRQEVVKSLYRNRQAVKEAMIPDILAEQSAAEGPLKETLIFDFTAFRRPTKEQSQFNRLPKGETIEIPIHENLSIRILLAKHKCHIVYRDTLVFVDDKGVDSELRVGRNVIGRDISGDIVMDANFRDISRQHLIVENDSDTVVKITDISSHGTSIEPGYLNLTTD